MAIEYKYPRVTISTLAKTHSVRMPERADTTVLFQPIYAKKGPVDKIVKLFTVDELITTYGEPDFATQGQSILNAINWLKNGGTVYAIRLTQPGVTTAVAKKSDDVISTITAKYPGSFYNEIELKFSWTYKAATTPQQDGKAYSFILKVGDYETFKAASLAELIIRVNDESDYVTIDPDFVNCDKLTISTQSFECTLSGAVDKHETTKVSAITGSNSGYKITIFDGYDINITRTANGYSVSGMSSTTIKDLFRTIKNKIPNGDHSVGNWLMWLDSVVSNSHSLEDIFEGFNKDFTNDELVRYLFGVLSSNKTSISTLGQIETILGNKLETPIDVILDAGYSEDTKRIISLYTKNVDQTLELARKDIVCIFDEYVNEYTTKYTGKRPTLCDNSCIDKCDNRALYTQYFLVDDDYAKNIWVTPTYFLAKLIPHNDRVYGVQWPTAGLTRGVLLDVKDINENPTPNIKNANFIDRINYVERDANGYKFMSQRTYDGSDETEYTALSFLNNSRSLAKMVKELEKVGREYLFEFNDATTLANMRNALNRYMGEWVSNRTLNFAEVDVAASEYSDEAVDVTLNIRFTGTIEVISVDIIIE